MFIQRLCTTTILATLGIAILYCPTSTAEPFENDSPEYWIKPYTSISRRRQVTIPESFQTNNQPLPNTEESQSKIQRVLNRVQETIRRQANCRLNKVKLSQLESYQYVEYAVNLPSFKQFHFCLWLRSFNLSTEHTLFSYAVPQNPDMIAMWISPVHNQTGFHLVVNGVKVYNLNYVLPVGKWTHICQSWNGNNGHWNVFVNGTSVGDGYGPSKLIGFQVAGGGRPITGQEQDLDMNKAQPQQGIEGEFTLFEMDDSALGVGARGSESLRQLQADCLHRLAGNLISWEKSHLKLFGGAEIYSVEPVCGSFPEY